MYTTKKDFEIKNALSTKTDRELLEIQAFLLKSNQNRLTDIESYLKFFVILTLIGIAGSIFMAMLK